MNGTKRLGILLLAVLLLCACARQPDLTAVWQGTLPNTGAELSLANCTVTEETNQFVEDPYSQEEWREMPTLRAREKAPVLTISGAEPDEVTVHFSEAVDILYFLYTRKEPAEKLDYIFTQTADGALQYQFDTVYNYLITVKTQKGEDTFLLICDREV